MLEALKSLAVSWGSIYSNHAVLRTAVTFAHIGGLVGAGGAAVTIDRGILAAHRHDEVERRFLFTSLQNTHAVVLAGLALVFISGVLLFAADVDTYVGSRLFWTKMVLVVLLMVNGAIMTAAERRIARRGHASWGTLRWTAIASLALWLLTTLSGTGLLNIG